MGRDIELLYVEGQQKARFIPLPAFQTPCRLAAGMYCREPGLIYHSSCIYRLILFPVQKCLAKTLKACFDRPTHTFRPKLE